jgi:glycerol-3-phosphate acyltransferase PlsX
MSAEMVIALDAMGGDHAPEMVIDGAALALGRMTALRFQLFGDAARVTPLLERHPRLREAVEVHHVEYAIASTDKPSQALRRKSSMRLAIEAVRDGHAAGVVSAGNTGALMALSKFVLKMQPGVDRPAMVSYFLTARGESALLDLGANVECDARNLVQFAILGAAFARSVLGVERPSVGLLNVGAEEFKGRDEVRAAAQVLRESRFGFDFHGFVEGDDIGAGTVDVVVTDGFTGNAVLKATEGTAKLISSFLGLAFRRSWVSKLGYALAKPALDSLRAKLDPRQYNGALFLGLNGVAVKSHGGTDGEGFASAISVAADMVRGDFNERIHADLDVFDHRVVPGEAPAPMPGAISAKAAS